MAAVTGWLRRLIEAMRARAHIEMLEFVGAHEILAWAWIAKPPRRDAETDILRQELLPRR